MSDLPVRDTVRPVDNALADDMIEGGPAIAQFLGKPERKVYYMLEKRQLPAFKFGGIWHARRSTLRAHIARLEAQAMGAADATA